MLDPQKVIKEACTGLFEQFFSFIEQYVSLYIGALMDICNQEFFNANEVS